MAKIGWMTTEQNQQVSDAINERSRPGDPCPNCEKTPSMTSPIILPLVVEFNGAMPARYLPVATTTCSQCGFIRFFSVNDLGLEDLEPKGHDPNMPAARATKEGDANG